MLKFFNFLLFMSFVFIPFRIFADEITQQKRIMTLQECIDTAVKQHPNIIGAKNTIDAGESRTGEAYANYYPQLSASADYNRISSTGITNSTGIQGVASQPD